MWSEHTGIGIAMADSTGIHSTGLGDVCRV